MHHGSGSAYTLEEAFIILQWKGVILRMKSPKEYRYDLPPSYPPALKCSLGDIVKRRMEDKRKLFEGIDAKDIVYQDDDSVFIKK
jgi:hypothetical protein